MESVYILIHRDGSKYLARDEVVRQRQLDQDAMNARVGVEL